MEVWILARFFVSKDLVNKFGDEVFEDMRHQSNNMHLAIAGGGSFTSMSTSPLAVLGCKRDPGSTTKESGKRTIEPRLMRNVTPQTKKDVKCEDADLLNQTMPEPRQVGRVEPRNENHDIPVASIGHTSIDTNGVPSNELIEEMRATIANNKLASSYASITFSLYLRLWKKSQRAQRGATVLADYCRSLALRGEILKPGVLMLSSKIQPDTLYPNLAKDKSTLGSIVEIFYLARVDRPNDTVSSLDNLSTIQIICKSGTGNGSFTGADKLKLAVLHDMLRSRVCMFSVSDDGSIEASSQSRSNHWENVFSGHQT